MLWVYCFVNLGNQITCFFPQSWQTCCFPYFPCLPGLSWSIFSYPMSALRFVSAPNELQLRSQSVPLVETEPSAGKLAGIRIGYIAAWPNLAALEMPWTIWTTWSAWKTHRRCWEIECPGFPFQLMSSFESLKAGASLCSKMGQNTVQNC